MNSEPFHDPLSRPSQVSLEEQLSYLQRQFDDLNSVVLQQQSNLAQLCLEQKRLLELVRGLLDRTGADLPHEKPPHY